MKILDAQRQISNEDNLRNIKQTISFITITRVSCLDSDFLHNKETGIVQHPPDKLHVASLHLAISRIKEIPQCQTFSID
jgi:hypothetical protein